MKHAADKKHNVGKLKNSIEEKLLQGKQKKTNAREPRRRHVDLGVEEAVALARDRPLLGLRQPPDTLASAGTTLVAL